MKSKLTLLAISFLFTIFSCNEEEGSPAQGVTATIDGAAFKAVRFNGVYEPSGISQIVASAENGDRLVFTLSSSVTPGTYDPAATGSINIVFTKYNGASYVADEGEFVLTTFNESRFECTFDVNASIGNTTISIVQGTAKVNMAAQQ